MHGDYLVGATVQGQGSGRAAVVLEPPPVERRAAQKERGGRGQGTLSALLLLAPVVAAVYRYAPNAVGLTFRSVLPGAVVAVLSWALVSLVFSFFLTVFPVRGVAYGSLGTAISLLLYLYFSAAVLLFGAELNAKLRRNGPKGGRTQGKCPNLRDPTESGPGFLPSHFRGAAVSEGARCVSCRSAVPLGHCAATAAPARMAARADGEEDRWTENGTSVRA